MLTSILVLLLGAGLPFMVTMIYVFGINKKQDPLSVPKASKHIITKANKKEHIKKIKPSPKMDKPLKPEDNLIVVNESIDETSSYIDFKQLKDIKIAILLDGRLRLQKGNKPSLEYPGDFIEIDIVNDHSIIVKEKLGNDLFIPL